MSNAYNLQRFLDAQERVYDTVLEELRAGRKSSHWIWFIFPQIAGLGHSAMAQQLAIGSLDEAEAHPEREAILMFERVACMAAREYLAHALDLRRHGRRLRRRCSPRRTGRQLRRPLRHHHAAAEGELPRRTGGGVTSSRRDQTPRDPYCYNA